MGETIVGSMKINAVFPLVFETGMMFVRWALRWLDGCGAGEGKTTKKTTIQQYVGLHCGPEYFMHFKYSGIMNIVFITMMFGTGLPILFPLAFFALAVLYGVETYMLYYGYKQPPAYDGYLNSCVLQNLSYAPFFMLAFGYWMLSSKQLLQNHYLAAIDRKGDAAVSNHVWFALPDDFEPAVYLKLFFFLYVAYLLFKATIVKAVEMCCDITSYSEWNIDETIDLYQNCLDDDDKNFSIHEEKTLRAHGIQTQFDETQEKLRGGKLRDEKMHLKGVHTYDILRNPAYSSAFQYFASGLPNRADYIIDDNLDEGDDMAQSDLVRIVLNLAFLREDELKKINFKFNADTCAKMQRL